MAEITASMVKDLREKSGAGMMDCKNALNENNGDPEAAMDWLRTKGIAKAAKKSGRTAAEGLVAVATQGNKGAVVEVNSETDFVARNDDFQALVENIAKVALENGKDAETLKKAKYPGTSGTVEEKLTTAIGVIGENISLRRSKTLQVNKGIVASYIHNAAKPGMGKIAVLVAVESEAPAAKLEQLGKQIAMHIAAAKPEGLTADEIDPALVEREKQIFIEQARESGKPDNIIEKMIEGRIRKYYEEVTLLEQVFIIDGKSKVKEIVAAAAKEAGTPIQITSFVCYVVGEGIEKETTDFAAEVKAAVNG